MGRYLTTVIDSETGEIVREIKSDIRPKVLAKARMEEVETGTEGYIDFLKNKGSIDRYGKIKLYNYNQDTLLGYLRDNPSIYHHVLKLVDSLSKTHNRILLSERTFITRYKQLKELLDMHERTYQKVCKKLKDDNIIREFNGYVYFNPVYYCKLGYVDIRTIICFAEELREADMVDPNIYKLIELSKPEELRRLEQ